MRRTRSRYAEILETDVHDDIFDRQLAFIINSQVSSQKMVVSQFPGRLRYRGRNQRTASQRYSYSSVHLVQFLCCS